MKYIKISILVIILLYSFSAYAERIVSLSPGITEILFAIGAGDDVVGVTQFCDYPEQAKKLPKVGSGFRPSIEQIVTMKPTLVLGSIEGAEKSVQNYLNNLEIKNKFYKSTQTKDIVDSIKSISALLNIDSGKIVRELEQLFYTYPPIKHTGLFLVGVNPFSAASGGTFVNDIMSCAGIENVLESRFNGYTIISYEYILASKPDYIFFSGSMGESGIQQFIARLKSSGIKSKIIKLDCDCFLRPSYRITTACKNLRKLVR